MLKVSVTSKNTEPVSLPRQFPVEVFNATDQLHLHRVYGSAPELLVTEHTRWLNSLAILASTIFPGFLVM
jgi:hypothetical protein